MIEPTMEMSELREEGGIRNPIQPEHGENGMSQMRRDRPHQGR